MMVQTGRVARTGLLGIVLAAAAVLGVHAADPPLTTTAAEGFYRKALLIDQQGMQPRTVAARRTTITENELNSYLTLRATPDLPQGLSKPRIGILGQGKVTGSAIVDLDVIRKKRASGNMMDPINLLGGQVPVTVTGVLTTRDGMAKFDLQDAEVSGFPVPKILIQELVSYYSRTPDHPDGYDVDEPSSLPYQIRSIEVGAGQAVVVQ